jgi:hypothetical protein
MGLLVEPIIDKMNQREADVWLANPRIRLEAEADLGEWLVEGRSF